MAKKKKTTKVRVKRKFTRFAPDPETMAQILPDQEGSPKIPITCLVVDESYGGCSVLALKNSIFKKNATITVKVGQMSPMLAQIRWIRSYAGKFCYVGLAYLV